jgi:hypothetical protein
MLNARACVGNGNGWAEAVEKRWRKWEKRAINTVCTKTKKAARANPHGFVS